MILLHWGCEIISKKLFSSVFKVSSGIEMTSAKLTNDIMQYVYFTLPSVIYEPAMDIICNGLSVGPK